MTADPTELTAAVLAAASDAGLDRVGITAAVPFAGTRSDLEDRKARGLHAGMGFTYRKPHRSADPTTALPDARSLVVAALRYPDEPGPSTPNALSGAVARYARADHYADLKDRLKTVSGVLRRAGHRTRVVADDNALVDREAAVRAGLGTYGKSSNVLLGRSGSWFVLGAVVTDAELIPSEPLTEDRCGPCRRCLDGCPTGAIIEPGVVDAGRCLSWLLQVPGMFPVAYRELVGNRLYGCDDCQEVCPENRRASSLSGTASADLDLVELLTAGDDELMARCDRWYVPDREADHVRRNALLALANVGDGSDGAVRDLVAQYLQHPNPVLRGHAVWAARRLGCDDLLAGDDDPIVIAELERPL